MLRDVAGVLFARAKSDRDVLFANEAFAIGVLQAVSAATADGDRPYSTVTDLARLRDWSTSVPRMTAVW